MPRWTWIPLEVVLAIHEEQLAEHGGALGVRDAGLLESALARPQNLIAYGETKLVDAAQLAAAYSYGIVRNHPFVDGNKRTGYVLMELFLLRHGHSFDSDDFASVEVMLKLASGNLSEDALAEWIRSHSKKSRRRI